MSARQLIVLVVAAIAAVGALILIRTMGGRHEPQAAENAAPINGEQVLVVARDVPQGAALTPSDLAVRLFPTESVNANFVRLTQSPSAQADYVGAVTRRAFVQGEPIVQGSVVKPEGRGFMAAQLEPGFRAVAVQVKAETAAGGYITPNDHVDVILTQTVQVRDGAGSRDQVRSDIVISDVRVLALDDVVQPQTSGEAPERHTADVAVLELTAGDARTLELAEGLGDISLALRGVQADTVGLNTPSASMSGLTQEQQASVKVHAFGTVTNGRRPMSADKVLRTSLAAVLSAAVAGAPGIAAAQVAPPDAQTMRITNGGGEHAASLVLPFGKSAIIDLPADARDILISNPQIADATVRTARRAYVIGRQIGQTNIFFFDAQGRQIANVEIRVEPDIAPLNEILGRHTDGANITAEAVNGSVVLSGTARSAAEADHAMQIADRFLSSSSGQSGGAGASAGSAAGPNNRIVNLIQVQGSEQVLVRVRIVEMSRTLVRQLGINLNYSEMINQLVGDDNFISAATANGFSINGQVLGGLAASAGVAENILRPNSYAYPGNNVDGSINTDQAGVGGYSFDPTTGQETWGPAHIDTARRTDAAIQAFERAGLLRVLAEPNLTAISGESARFLAGGEFPVPVNSDNGQISVEFKPFGVGLGFTPVVLSGGRISLKLSTEVSELTSEGAINTGDTPIRNADGTTTVIHGITIPALQVRRAETTLELPSGGSIVLAGLIQERTRHALEGVPGVMNTPVIGSLFRSRDFINNETELVIIVTPYLVHATSPDQLRTPADGFRNPSERESLLTGRLNSLYRPPANDQAGEHRELQGPHGHVIE